LQLRWIADERRAGRRRVGADQLQIEGERAMEEFFSFLLRWFHFLAGITWIGILYYFNFIQTPFFGTDLGGEAKGAMTRGLVPNALWWFRWAAMFTFVTGVLIILMKLGHGEPLSGVYMTRILTGGLMGTLMWANVWFVIWPAQQVVIANANNVAGGGQADPSAAARAARAGLASRTNTLFSIPMLFFMAAASHLPASLSASLARGEGQLTGYWISALVVIAVFEAGALMGPGLPTQKPLATVKGTIHAGFAVTIVVFGLQLLLLR
jgi:uncharacterized membrane protein